MEQVVSSNQDHDIEFVIDNTQYEISVQLLFIIWAYIFMLILFFMTGNSYIEEGKAYSYWEFFVSQLTNGRFLSILIAFLIFIPIFMILEIRKIRKRDNVIYFYDDGIMKKDLFIPIEKIKEIKTGCCPLNGGIFKYIFVFGIGGFMGIPFTLLEMLTFFLMKLRGRSDLKSISYKFLIAHTADKHGDIRGYCYDEATLQKLIAFKNKLKAGE